MYIAKVKKELHSISMEKFIYRDSYPLINPAWERSEVRDLIFRHRENSQQEGIYESFINAMLHDLDAMKNYVGDNQADKSKEIAYQDAPIVVITNYDEINDELYIKLGKIDINSGWLLSAAERKRIDTSLVNLGAILSDGDILISDYFSSEQFKIIDQQRIDYSKVGFNFTLAHGRHIDNHVIGIN